MEWTRLRPEERASGSRRNVEQLQKESGSRAPALRLLSNLVRRYTVRNERMRVCETLSLGGRRSVALIECDGQRFLAGMSSGGVETLIAVPDAKVQGAMR